MTTRHARVSGVVIGVLVTLSFHPVPAVAEGAVSAMHSSAANVGLPSPSQEGASSDAYQERGKILGAPYRVRIPNEWNGTLLVYAPGYRDQADGGEPDRQTLPPPVSIAPDLTIADDGGMEEFLLAQGYGLAGTRYRDDGVRLDGVDDLVNLMTHLREVIPTTAVASRFPRMVLVGCSLGAAHAAVIAEMNSPQVDGVITLGIPGAGLLRTADYLLAFQLAYDVTFGWPPEWGEVGDVRNAGDGQQDLDWEDETLPRVVQQSTDPRNRGRFEFIRLVLGLPVDGFYPGSSPDPGNIPWLYAVTLLATEAAADAEGRLKGSPYRNLNHRYSLSATDQAYLRSLDPSLDPDGLLVRMNARTTYQGDGRARSRLDQAYRFNGNLLRPLIAMHHTADGVIPAWQATLYRQSVARAGQQDRLVQVFVPRVSHCAFTVGQVTAAIAAMEAWLDSGTRPGPEAFPTSAGFTHNYTTPRWPFER